MDAATANSKSFKNTTEVGPSIATPPRLPHGCPGKVWSESKCRMCMPRQTGTFRYFLVVETQKGTGHALYA